MKHLLLALIWVPLALVIFIVHIWESMREKRELNEINEHGETIEGWVVNVKPMEWNPEEYIGFGRVLISFPGQNTASLEQLERIAGELTRALSAEEIPSEDVDFVKFLKSRRIHLRKRLKVPEKWAGCLDVYLVNVFIKRADLPLRQLTSPALKCRAIPGEKGLVIVAGAARTTLL